jgi:hypothetical protein
MCGGCAQSLPQEAEELVDELPTEQGAARFPAEEVVRTKSFFLPPMSLEEALEQVGSSGLPVLAPSLFPALCETQTPPKSLHPSDCCQMSS